MHHTRPITVDATKIPTRRELALVLADLKAKAPRSKNSALNLILIRLACSTDEMAGGSARKGEAEQSSSPAAAAARASCRAKPVIQHRSGAAPD